MKVALATFTDYGGIMKKIFILMLICVCLIAVLVSCDEKESNSDKIETKPSASDTESGEIAEHTHSFKEAIVREATCSASGIKANQCSCGEVEEGSETLLPFLPHSASEATCEADSVCTECGKILVEKYDHVMVETVLSEASCTDDGVMRSACFRCGKSNDTVIPASHELDMSHLSAANGKIGSKCIKCGEIAGYTEEAPLLFLEFEEPAEAEKYSTFTFTYPAVVDGVAYPQGNVWIGYDVDKIKTLPKYVVSFDFCLTADGLTDKGESIFTFIGGVDYKLAKPGTKQDWVWAIKYFESNGSVSTVMSGFNDSNSYKVEKGTWYNFIGIVDNATRELSVYIDGTYIGKRTLSDYNNEAFGGAFSMRIYDAVPVNGTSSPKFDNLKIAEIK